LPVLGAVARYDYAGLDMVRDGLNEAPIKVAEQDTVPAILNELVNQGHFGVKTGRGFFNYADREPQAVLRDRDQKLIKVKQLLAKLLASNAA
jgi:3-hydroxybutyryl-CoA dehydrogenase